MFSTSDVEPLLGVESNALGNGWEVTAKLSEDVAELRVAVSFLHHSQVNEAVSGITVCGGGGGGGVGEGGEEV